MIKLIQVFFLNRLLKEPHVFGRFFEKVQLSEFSCNKNRVK